MAVGTAHALSLCAPCPESEGKGRQPVGLCCPCVCENSRKLEGEEADQACVCEGCSYGGKVG